MSRRRASATAPARSDGRRAPSRPRRLWASRDDAREHEPAAARPCAVACSRRGAGLGSGDSTAHERERSDPDGGRFRRPGQWRRSPSPPSTSRTRAWIHGAPPKAAVTSRRRCRRRVRARTRSERTDGALSESSAESWLSLSPRISRAGRPHAGRRAASARPPPTWLRALLNTGRGSRRPAWCRRARRRPARGKPGAGGGGSSTAWRATASSQASGSRGAEPFSSARCAERKTCCVASSASDWSRRSERQDSPRRLRARDRALRCRATCRCSRLPVAPWATPRDLRPNCGLRIAVEALKAMGVDLESRRRPRQRAELRDRPRRCRPLDEPRGQSGGR